MRLSFARLALSLFLGLLLGSYAVADVTLPSVLGSSMVLQRNMKIPIWGKANPGEKVTVEIGEQRKSTVAGANGEWLLNLRSMKIWSMWWIPTTALCANRFRWTLPKVIST